MIVNTQFGPGDDSIDAKSDAKMRQFRKRKTKHRKKVKAGRKRRLANLRKRG